MVFCDTHETLAVLKNTVEDFRFGFCQVSRAIVQTVDFSPEFDCILMQPHPKNQDKSLILDICRHVLCCIDRTCIVYELHVSFIQK